jgi:chemotaxis protein CheD
MFIGSNEKLMLDIGKRNASMARQVLNKLRIRIAAEELGGNRGRTMILDTVNGNVYIRMAGAKLYTI